MYLLFDFDGTLVDSFDCMIKKVNILAVEMNFKKINDDEIIYIKDLSAKELLKFLKIPFYKIPSLILKIREKLQDEMNTLTAIEQMPDIIKKLHQENFTLGILTSNSIENVSTWLTSNHIRDCFSFIHIESKSVSKKALLKKTLKKYKINPAETFYIGDEVRDIEAANKNKVKSIAVTWGYNSEKTLLKHKPSFIVTKPDEILTICHEQ